VTKIEFIRGYRDAVEKAAKASIAGDVVAVVIYIRTAQLWTEFGDIVMPEGLPFRLGAEELLKTEGIEARGQKAESLLHRYVANLDREIAKMEAEASP
jgi:hypothetical protein